MHELIKSKKNALSLVYFRRKKVIQIGVDQAHVGGRSEPVGHLKCDFVASNYKRRTILSIYVPSSRYKPWMSKILQHFQ